jgi:protein gp37
MSTKIEWTDETWNPITGCTPISEGCQNCYAKRMANRLKGRYGYSKDDPFKVTYHPGRLAQPLKWKKPRKIFVCSMGDIFHPDVKREWAEEVWNIMARCPQHTFIILTKRPENAPMADNWWFPNIWLGVTAENQKRANVRIPILLRIPAAVLFVSVEPMLSEIYLTDIPIINSDVTMNVLKRASVFSPHIDWVICGAETGPGARYMDPAWARALHYQCRFDDVPFFFKKASAGWTLELPREYPNVLSLL